MDNIEGAVPSDVLETEHQETSSAPREQQPDDVASTLRHELGVDISTVRERAENPFTREVGVRSAKNLSGTIDSFIEVYSKNGLENKQRLDEETEKSLATICRPFLEQVRRAIGPEHSVNHQTPDETERTILQTFDALAAQFEGQTAESVPMHFEDPLAAIAEYTARIRDGQRSRNIHDGLHNALANLRIELAHSLRDQSADRIAPSELERNVRKELERVRETAFIGINIDIPEAMQFLEDGEYTPLTDMAPDQQGLHADKLSGSGSEHYRRHRASNERILHQDFQLSPEQDHKGIIYGTLGSQNGRDEIQGGAPQYGSIVLKLRPEIAQRATFSEGDSLNPGQPPEYSMRKTFRVGARDFSETARPSVQHKLSRHDTLPTSPESTTARQLRYDDALASKAILNVENDILATRDQTVGMNDYIEAHIFGGVTLDDVEEIRVPALALEYAERVPFHLQEKNQQLKTFQPLIAYCRSRPELEKKLKFV